MRRAPDADVIQSGCGVRGDLLPHGFEQRRQPVAGGRRNSVERNTPALQMLLQPRQPLRIVERVDLVGGDDDRLVLQPLAGRVASRKQRELPRDDVEVLDRIAAGDRRDVDEVHQHLGPLEMAQEPMAQPVSLVRALQSIRARRRRRTCGRRTG